MSESKDSVVLGIRMRVEELEKWKRFCKTHLNGAKPTSTAKRVVMDLMDPPFSNQIFKSQILLTKENDPGTVKKEIRISVTESEYEAIKNAASLVSVSSSAWVASAARASLRFEGEPLPRELIVLKELNKTLQSLGQNTNQIARRLNRGENNLKAEALELEKLTSAIDEHRTWVSKFIQSCSDRWNFKNFK